jgi:glycogen debranching enzyme
MAGSCFDVVGEQTPDGSIRPNQLLAMSLAFPVLQADRWERVLESVRRDLLTPFGLRTLSPRDANYVGFYAGGIVARDRGYHNGTAFPWLLGPFITASMRLTGRSDAARANAAALLEPCLNRLCTTGLGLINELFDGDAPHSPGGAIACAIATGELLRCHVEDVLDKAPRAAIGSCIVSGLANVGEGVPKP